MKNFNLAWETLENLALVDGKYGQSYTRTYETLKNAGLLNLGLRALIGAIFQVESFDGESEELYQASWGETAKIRNANRAIVQKDIKAAWQRAVA